MIMYTHSAEYEEKRNDEREALVELCAELVETSGDLSFSAVARAFGCSRSTLLRNRPDLRFIVEQYQQRSMDREYEDRGHAATASERVAEIRKARLDAEYARDLAEYEARVLAEEADRQRKLSALIIARRALGRVTLTELSADRPEAEAQLREFFGVAE